MSFSPDSFSILKLLILIKKKSKDQFSRMHFKFKKNQKKLRKEIYDVITLKNVFSAVHQTETKHITTALIS